MPCYHPMQVRFGSRTDGKKVALFLSDKIFREGGNYADGAVPLPCGRCMGCRLERSRQWAVRCMHEASLNEDNCFITLTFDDEHLAKMCPDGSLSRKHMQDFMKRLRRSFSDTIIRVFYCGEYGDKLGRPHYHAILFGFDFKDKEFWKEVNGQRYYTSACLRKIWPYGHSVVGSATFESAAYIARYCTKKRNGVGADEYYSGKSPEFGQASLKPGLGRDWIEKFGDSDVFSFDEVVVNGVRTKPPRYYDKILAERDPEALERVKTDRAAKAALKVDDSTYKRLLTRERCQEARMKSLFRRLEVTNA